MAKVIGFIFLAALALYALKIAILIVFLAGIIFRTRETLSLIVVLGALALFRNYPLACCIIVVLAAVIALAKMNGREGEGEPEALSQITDQTGS